MRVNAGNRWPNTVNRGARFPGVVNSPRASAPGPAPLPVPVDLMLSRSALAGQMTVVDDQYQVPATGLPLGSTVDLRGKRVMHVLRGTADITLLSGGVTVALVAGTFPDTTPAVRIVVAGVQSPLMKWDSGWHIYEYELTAAGLRFWLDGFEYAPGTLDVTDPSNVTTLGSASGVAVTGQADLVVMAAGDVNANQMREFLLKAYIPALAPLAQSNVYALDTARVTMLDPQMEPKALIAADAAQGIDQTNPANPGYYHDLAYKNHAEAPVSISGTVGPMSVVRDLVPGARYIRTGINKWQFDDQGNMLEPAYQQKLDEWVAAGGKWMPTHMWLGQEKWPQPVIAQGTQAQIDYVTTTVPEVFLEGWRRFWLWFAKQSPAMQNAIHVIDLLNEPEVFNRTNAIDVGTPAHVWYTRFADLQVAAARLVPAHWRGVVLVSGWGYSAKYDELKVLDPYNLSAKAKMEQALGNRMKWSFHHYPSWGSGSTPSAYYANLMQKAAFTGPNKLILTEMNVDDFEPETESNTVGFQMSRIMSRLTRGGIGIGHFPGINFAAVIGFDGSSTPEFRRPDRTAAFIDAATILDTTPYEIVHPQAKVFSSEADLGTVQTTGIHIRVGGAGGETFTATTTYRTMFFGSQGNDDITISPTQWTWVYGQDGNDTIRATTGPGGIIFLGDGDDIVHLGAGRLSVYGGFGADTFVLNDSGHAYLDNFEVGSDKIDVNGIFTTRAAFKAACVPENGHLVLTMPNGGKVTILNRGTVDPVFLVPDLEPDTTPFPALSGTIYHYRAEDVDENGADVAHGVSMPLQFTGVLNFVDVGGVLYLDGDQGMLSATHPSWGDPLFSIWVLSASPRTTGVAINNSGPTYTVNNPTLRFLRNGSFHVGDRGVSFAGLPTHDGPEVMQWDMAITNGSAGQMRLYVDNVLQAAPTGTTARVFDFTGTLLTLGGSVNAAGDLVPTGLQWKDIVIKRNGVFTDAERAALQDYAVARMTP